MWKNHVKQNISHRRAFLRNLEHVWRGFKLFARELINDAVIKQFNPCRKDTFFLLQPSTAGANGDPNKQPKLLSKLFFPLSGYFCLFLVVNA